MGGVLKNFSPGPEPAIGGPVFYHVRYHVLTAVLLKIEAYRDVMLRRSLSLSVAKDRVTFMFQVHCSPSNESRIPQDVNLYVLFYFQYDKGSSIGVKKL